MEGLTLGFLRLRAQIPKLLRAPCIEDRNSLGIRFGGVPDDPRLPGVVQQ